MARVVDSESMCGYAKCQGHMHLGLPQSVAIELLSGFRP